MGSVPQSWTTPAPSSIFGALLERRARHPDEFDCAVRVVSGAVRGESTRWRYRRSAVDPLVPDWDVVVLTHGDVVLRLRFDADEGRMSTRVRPYHRVWLATELGSGAGVEVAADAGEALRLRVDV